MSHLPAPLARRLDRLSRRAHAFHRFAHHPLCGAYAGEVFRVGPRTRLCRGCTLAGLGAVAGAAAGALAPGPPLGALVAALVLAVPAALAASAPRTGPRPKLLTRAVPTALAAALLAWGLGAGTLAGSAVALAALAAAAIALARYRRRGPDRRACAACPERAGPRTCSGFRPIVRREAAFARMAGRLLASAAAPPGVESRRGGSSRASRAGAAIGPEFPPELRIGTPRISSPRAGTAARALACAPPRAAPPRAGTRAG